MTRSRRVMPGCSLPLKRTSTDSGMSRGIMPRAAAKATRPEPAGKEMPMGKRVWESPPVPTVSGSSMRFSQEWMTPSPGAAPRRRACDEGRQVLVHLDVDRLRVGGGVAEGLHHQVGWNPRQASSLSSSAVMGPVVSWEPTVVIFGSQ